MDRSIKIGLASFALTVAALVGPTLARADNGPAPAPVAAAAPHVSIAGFSA